MGISPVAHIPWGKVESLYHWIFLYFEILFVLKWQYAFKYVIY